MDKIEFIQETLKRFGLTEADAAYQDIKAECEATAHVLTKGQLLALIDELNTHEKGV